MLYEILPAKMFSLIASWKTLGTLTVPAIASGSHSWPGSDCVYGSPALPIMHDVYKCLNYADTKGNYKDYYDNDYDTLRI